jgi:hypothetical protein
MAKEHKLLTPIERAQLADWGGDEWMSSPRRMAARRRVLRTIGKLVVAGGPSGVSGSPRCGLARGRHHR